jgi:hypothetical protein
MSILLKKFRRWVKGISTKDVVLLAAHDALNYIGSPVHIAPACVGSVEGSDHFGSYVRSLSLRL